MEIFKIEDMKGGWFVGNFTPAAFKSKDFEVCLARHKKGDKWATHYHQIATEINLLVRGEMSIQGQGLKSGDIFVIHPGEIADPVFHEDCEVVVVKTPSVPGDKYEVTESS